MKHPTTSVVRYQDVSVVRIHDVQLARLYDVFCKSQIKHPQMLWYVSITSQRYVFATPCQQVSTAHSNYFPISTIWQGFQVSFKYQIKYHIFLVATRRETKRVVWIINQQNFYYIIKTPLYNNNTCNIYCVYISW